MSLHKLTIKSAFVAVSMLSLSACQNAQRVKKDQIPSTIKPNIVIIVTDDQGYGDLGMHSNPIIQTPNIDALAQESVRLTNFHVDPTCSPTRSALLTGKHSLKAGVWHTILGRYMLGPEHETIAETLKSNGYDTGIFGKWHLGDNYPYRPQEQGFNEVFIHGGGGVGQTPDYWGNTQFDDTYYRNGVEEKTKGNATTVWFDSAIDFIDEKRNQPYFTFIALNAPHGPYRAPNSYIKPYIEKGLDGEMARFYGMISHIDDQVARLRKHIKARGELDNTIFVFMTDNGSSHRQTHSDLTLKKQYQWLTEKYPKWLPNAGMNGYKGYVHDGGHRVPFFISYPNGNLKTGDYNNLTAHYDIMPTLLELAGVELADKNIDGSSLATLFTQGEDKRLDDRSVVITNQRVYHPSDKRPTAVATQKWRFISQNNKELLFDIELDPGQQTNVIAKFPEVADQLRAEKLLWWTDAKNAGFKDRYIGVGNPAENPVRLNAMDWMEVPDSQPVPWFIGHQAAADEYDYTHWLTEEKKYYALPWYINVEQTGNYQVKAYYHDIPAATPVLKKYCIIDANGKQYIERVYGRASHCVVDIPLNHGQQKITAWFTDDKNKTTSKAEKAAFYLYIEHKP